MSRLKRILLLLLCFLMAATLMAEGQKEGEKKYPSKPIKFIIPFGAGGNTDLLARSMAEVMKEKLGQPLVGVNVTGGGGTIGTADALSSAPDGYTIELAASGPLYTQPFILNLQYSKEDYVTIAQVSYVPRVLVAKPDTPYDNVEELIAYAKANPGKVQVGIAATGSTDHFGFEQLLMDNSVDMNLIPQGGGNAQKVAVLGGHVDIAAITVTEGKPLVESGQVKALGVMHGTRDGLFPNIETFEEQGYSVESGVGFYLIAPKDVPAEYIAILEKAVDDTLHDPGYLATADKLNLVLTYLDADGAQGEINKFYNLYQKLANQIGLKKK